ncbi:nucleotide pyrophosphatase/phosphodiesterase family protein [Algivirga pacifica]|uniref:Alkaline phosphatase family protein n=1 Tax=Algivirga pacifica TaxID=1162670 RepID=A0ABP9D9R8_9BACT
MNRTAVLNVVGLSSNLLAMMPFLSQWLDNNKYAKVQPAFPAVTTTAQYTYLTGCAPKEHGIVGNGWYFREECEVKFWRQSANLVQQTTLWERLKEEDPSFTCANMFWWYNMYSSADFSVTPRPIYTADGRKIPDVYANPLSLRDRLQKKLGRFPLFEFWGPNTSINSSQWIAKAAMLVDEWHAPTLNLIYLPHLDYCLQKYGHDYQKIAQDLKELDELLHSLITYFESLSVEVVVLSEYGITNVDTTIALNRLLRTHGFITVKEELGKELLDPGASRAFAVADHQVAHVYVKDAKDIPIVRELLKAQEGIAEVLDADGKKSLGVDHDRAGELIAIAKENVWFTYYYWLNDAKAPDFAPTVDIHRKPGYDPAELFIDPEIKYPKAKVIGKLLLKKMGFRTLLDVIPLEGSFVKGSHGVRPQSKDYWPIYASSNLETEEVAASDVYHLLYKTIYPN